MYQRRYNKSDKVGKLDKRLTVFSEKDSSDDGWESNVIEVVAKIWGQMIDDRMYDYRNALNEGTNKLIYFKVRYNKLLNTKMLVEYKELKYEIIDILDADERQKYMTLVVERKDL
ncbi:phage head closure protein [Macrococcoides goetzii]|uniref:phage head closure protein n=1 Tax=Macrococcus sp. PK TaxID=2801919 RepID=UPI001F0D2EE2|nr:phage head closure protein [Macrococcus sp. PK]MCH4983976.1 phage head closure protein [Macrococcus sp. PK]